MTKIKNKKVKNMPGESIFFFKSTITKILLKKDIFKNLSKPQTNLCILIESLSNTIKHFAN